MERSKPCEIGSKTLLVFPWLLRAAAAKAQFPFHWKGWPKARVGTPALAVRPMPVTRNSDAHITTPPFGHPFLKKKGNWDRTGTAVPMRGINYGRESWHCGDPRTRPFPDGFATAPPSATDIQPLTRLPHRPSLSLIVSSSHRFIALHRGRLMMREFYKN